MPSRMWDQDFRPKSGACTALLRQDLENERELGTRVTTRTATISHRACSSSLLGGCDATLLNRPPFVSATKALLGLLPKVTWWRYGLRWELNTPQEDAGKRIQAFRPGQPTSIYHCELSASDPLTATFASNDCSPTGPAASVFPLGLVLPGDKGVPAGLTNNYLKSLAPRFGLAWSPEWTGGWVAKLSGGPGKSSVRMGWGMFYDSNEELMLESFAAQPPFGGSTFISNVFFNTPFLGQNGTVTPNPLTAIRI
jgi:hypothetical protein